MKFAFRLFIVILLLSSVGLLPAVASGASGIVHIDRPAVGAGLSGIVEVRGTALLANSTPTDFRYYRLEYNHVDDTSHSVMIAGETIQDAQVSGGLLDTWDTTQVPNGTYIVRLQIYGNRGMIKETLTTVTVWNDLLSPEPTGEQAAFLGVRP